MRRGKKKREEKRKEKRKEEIREEKVKMTNYEIIAFTAKVECQIENKIQFNS